MSEYVYVLVSSALPGLCKIGRTSLSPAERADSISSATGVPARFVVVWWEEVSCGLSAEKAIHNKLDSFRENRRREFFRIECKKAIELVHAVCKHFPPIKSPPLSDSDFGPWVGTARMHRSSQIVQVGGVFITIKV